LYWSIQGRLDGILTEEVLGPAHEYLQINETSLRSASTANEDQVGWLMTASLILGSSGALAGLLLGGGMVWTLRRSIFRIDVQLRDTAGMLSEVAGPVTVTHAQDLRDVPAALQTLAEPIRHLVERIHQSRREALRSEQLAMVGQMAAGIAHEVRNPLMAIKLLVQAGMDRGRGGRLDGRDLQILEEEISRLEGLITTFLDFARPPRPAKVPVDVVQVLDHVRHLVASPAQLRGVEVRVDAAEDLPVIEADRGQLHQLFFNLLLNAVDASPVDGRVWVSARRIDPDDGGPPSIVVRIRDEGQGLPVELGTQIFEPFVSTKETGLGLGLSICRRIAQMHRGTITAEDAPGGGAVFTVSLPALQGAPVELAQGS
jgi:signal transduction histidine kinase